ncbi:MAG: UDP-N-acetylmuramoyl-tripeptide--D-alanyl-D-alanine ligase [Candidatus Nealsonbacteria bacterium]
MFYILSLFWLTRTTKITLFYFYLWQLKEYQVKRFIDHFRTDKGKQLLFGKFILVKIIIFIPFIFLLYSKTYLGREFFLSAISGALLFLYIFEILVFLKNIFQKNLKKPVLTKKTGFLILFGLIIEFVIIAILITLVKDVFVFFFWLLLFDILFPLIVSSIVLLIQPFSVLYRNKMIIDKAKIKRKEFKNLKVIGITGSFGKTSTKEILYTILSSKFKTLKTSEHQNSEVGISQCILNELKLKHEIFIVEMGTYGRGGIKLLSDIAKPEIGILTGINQQHMSLFGSQDIIVKTKYELIESLPKNGLAVFNGDNKYCIGLYKSTNIAKKLLYSSKKAELKDTSKPDIWTENIKMEKEYISFKVQTKDGQSADFKVNILGIQNVPNILGAILVAKELDMNLNEISKACLEITQDFGAMKLIKGKDDPFVLSAVYSTNPDGVIADLDYLKIWQGKKAIIMPSLIELGESSKDVHFKIGQQIGEACDLAIITTSERFEELKKGAIESGMKKDNILFLEKPDDIIEHINNFSSPGDVILLEGRVPKEISDFLKK